MKSTILLLLALFLACTACEKDPVEPIQEYENLLGLWTRYHDVDGVASDVWIINGKSYSYELTIHSFEHGEIETFCNGNHIQTHQFYLELTKDSAHISYDNWNQAVPPMLPAFGWHKYLQYEMDGQEVFLLGYHIFFRHEI